MNTSATEHGSDHNRLLSSLENVKQRYHAANPESYARWQNARNFMPGGNTRTVLHYDPFPVSIVKGDGTYVHDLDGHRYTDFLGEYSAGLYGHSNEVILDAIREAIAGGMTLGGPNNWESKFAEAVCERFPSIDLVRFTNSGTEANLMALGAARAHTGRDRILVMDGGYHGGVLYFGSRNSPVNAPFDLVFGRFNDIERTLDLIDANRNELAAVLIEPMMGSAGCIAADKEYLTALRAATEKHGIVLIFDEVMTSRSSSGGLQKVLGILPDMTTVGKYLGGGCSFGGFGGRRDIMELFDPTSPKALSHAGTFNNNVMTMAAGYIALTKVFTEDAADQLYARGETLRGNLNAIVKAKGAKVQVTGVGSILGVHPVDHPITAPDSFKDQRLQHRQLLHLEMLMHGFVFAQRGYMSLNLAMTDEDLAGLATAFASVLDMHADCLS
ncbi:MAG: aminotransferase class III-fold pyridoxal phosphate-dependent enzyme [Hyphomicrobiales bacterium]|nr:aminotransferase class III-fold pyridoxal phosphate-dependent enzyme [Hyphomicrobiales bacterium]MCP5370260.1 aminotransferase class III-fold pyridoxal phosphate-dependent enzyme [Hyphomicrobiales bacterium]